MAPLQGSGGVPHGVGDAGDISLGVDGGMERGDAQILPPLGVGKVPGEGGKRMVRSRGATTHILKSHHVAIAGGYAGG